MPTYSYSCTECGNAFDIHQAFTDDSLTECPVCGGRLRKVFGAVGVSFSGSGFYRNDSRAAERSGAEKKDSGSSESSASSTTPSKSPDKTSAQPVTSSNGGGSSAPSPSSSPSTPAPSTPASTPSKS